LIATKKSKKHGGKPFMFAGLWEHWEREGKAIDSCTIVTTEANATVKPFHERMPVVLAPKSYKDWLDASSLGVDKLFKPSPSKEWTARPVSTIVNSPKNDRPECLESPA
jgi:putative SOS response-associated peptidase YedK